uniref:peripheral myelin protein 22-like n=1 Tax=Pristiophorus japonicus TaxID=55135 RepID=UPI00398F3986
MRERHNYKLMRKCQIKYYQVGVLSRMYLLLPSLLLLHLTALILLYVATINNSWWWYGQGMTGDLWRHCWFSDLENSWDCNSSLVSGGEEWLHAVQASMVIAVMFSTASFVIFLCQLYTLRRGSLFYATGLFQIFAGLCLMAAALIYTLHVMDIHQDSTGSFSYCFALAWIAFALTLSSGVMYIHLRKLE